MFPVFGVSIFVTLMLLSNTGVASSKVGCRCQCDNPICNCICGDFSEMGQYLERTNYSNKAPTDSKRSKIQSVESKPETLKESVSSEEGSSDSEAYKEELIPMELIKGTKLFTGLAYRLHHQPFGKAPIVISGTTEGLEVRWSERDVSDDGVFYPLRWHKVPYRVVAERRQSEWPKYVEGGELELNALFMFIKSEKENAFELINVGASRLYPASSVNSWIFWHWNTKPSTVLPHGKYCRDIENGCGYIITPKFSFRDYNSWKWDLTFDEKRRVYNLGQFVKGQQLIGGGKYCYLGFEDAEEEAYMGLYEEKGKGGIQLELAGSQLSGRIISFKLEKNKIANLQEVTVIQSHDIINNSSKDITQTFEISKTISSTYTFGFSKTVKAFTKLSIKAGISIGENSKAPSGKAESSNNTALRAGGPSGSAELSAEAQLDVSVTDNLMFLLCSMSRNHRS